MLPGYAWVICFQPPPPLKGKSTVRPHGPSPLESLCEDGLDTNSTVNRACTYARGLWCGGRGAEVLTVPQSQQLLEPSTDVQGWRLAHSPLMAFHFPVLLLLL